jgi:hypothetical protein
MNEYRNLKLNETTNKIGTKVEWRKLEEINQVGFIIHMYIEISQRNSLFSSQAKMSWIFILSFLFLFKKTGEQAGRACPAHTGRLAPVGVGRYWGTGVGGRMWCNKISTHVPKCKNDTCWNYSRNWGRGGWRRMVEEVNSCTIYLIHCNNLCKCHNVSSNIITIKGKNKY